MNFNVKFLMQPFDNTKFTDPKNNTVTITVGLSGSGKSTYYKDISKIVNDVNELDQLSVGDTVQINRDELRLWKCNLDEDEYHKLPFTKKFEDEITEDFKRIFIAALKQNNNVVLTNTNLKPEYYTDILHICKNLGVNVYCHLFMINENRYYENTLRNGNPHWKNNPIAKGILKLMAGKLYTNSMPLIIRGYQEKMIKDNLFVEFDTKNIVDLYEHGFSLVPTDPNLLKNIQNHKLSRESESYFVCDVDGTLAHNDPEIRDAVDNSNYDKLQTDKVDYAVNLVYSTLKYYHRGLKSIILSGRYNKTATQDWLYNNEIQYDEFHCRDYEDRRPDWIVKLDLIYGLVKKYHKLPMLSIDDRNIVVKAYRMLGIKVFQCQDGDF